MYTVESYAIATAGKRFVSIRFEFEHMKKYIGLFISLYFSCLFALAQADKIQADRPGETLSPFLTKKRIFPIGSRF